ncbi:hypothetical protein COTS27_00576 [Spirochaetota bacterium]|nr:hypothetical protein COTS27_00576 [Spirochaetota bacterium]
MKKNILLKSLRHFFIKSILFLIRFYQQALAPHFVPTCRYLPTCSQYAYEAFEKRGILKGMILTTRRLASCHPFAEPKFDPVPDATPPAATSSKSGSLKLR